MLFYALLLVSCIFYLNSDLSVFQVRDLGLLGLQYAVDRCPHSEAFKELLKYKRHSCSIQFLNGRVY